MPHLSRGQAHEGRRDLGRTSFALGATPAWISRIDRVDANGRAPSLLTDARRPERVDDQKVSNWIPRLPRTGQTLNKCRGLVRSALDLPRLAAVHFQLVSKIVLQTPNYMRLAVAYADKASRYPRSKVTTDLAAYVARAAAGRARSMRRLG